MFLFLGIILIVLGSIVEAIGKDWEKRERNSFVRANAIIGAIEDSTNYISEEIRKTGRSQTQCIEDFLNSNDKIEIVGNRKMRRRSVYNEQGIVIAEELVEIWE